MATLEELEEMRKERMQRLADLLDRRQRYVDYLEREDRKEIDRLEQERSEAAKNWGGDVTKGAAAGLAVGGPVGALVGGIAGAASGQKRAYQQRREEGGGRAGSFFKTIFDIPGSLPRTDTLTGLSPAAANTYGGYKSRTQKMPAAPTSLTPEQLEIKSRYEKGVAETEPDPYADIWEFEARKDKQKKG